MGTRRTALSLLSRSIPRAWQLGTSSRTALSGLARMACGEPGRLPGGLVSAAPGLLRSGLVAGGGTPDLDRDRAFLSVQARTEEDLQRHQPSQPLVAGAEHHGHPARLGPAPPTGIPPRAKPAGNRKAAPGAPRSKTLPKLRPHHGTPDKPCAPPGSAKFASRAGYRIGSSGGASGLGRWVGSSDCGY